MSDFTPTKAWARRNLKAVEELIEFYEKLHGFSTYNMGECPLCHAVRDTWGDRNCHKCPWVVFAKEEAGAYQCEARNFRRDRAYQRLPRLYGWRTRLKNFIAGKTVWDKKTRKFKRAA